MTAALRPEELANAKWVVAKNCTWLGRVRDVLIVNVSWVKAISLEQNGNVTLFLGDNGVVDVNWKELSLINAA